MWAGTNFKAAELHGMTLFNRGDLVLKDSLTPTRGAGVRGVGGGGPGWGSLLLLLGIDTVTHRPTPGGRASRASELNDCVSYSQLS